MVSEVCLLIYLHSLLTITSNTGAGVYASRAAFSNALGEAVVGSLIDLADLSLGTDPKHFAAANFIWTSQVDKFWNEVQGHVQAQKPRQAAKLIASGPPGMGKSYIAWGLAAKAFASGYAVFYLADSPNWFKENWFDGELTSADRLCSMTKLLFDFNWDIISSSDDHLGFVHQHGQNWSFKLLYKLFNRLRCVILLDEHGKLYKEAKKSLSDLDFSQFERFFRLQEWDAYPQVSIVVSGSTQSLYEIDYLKNGCQGWRRLVLPLRPDEAQVLCAELKLDSDEIKDAIGHSIEELTNFVPREIRTLSDYRQQRGNFEGYVTERCAELLAKARAAAKDNDAFVKELRRNLVSFFRSSHFQPSSKFVL